MIKFENTVEIALPINAVFSFVGDFENVPKWNYYVTNVRQITGGLPGAGTIYHQTRKHDVQDFQILDYEPYHKVSIMTINGSTPSFSRSLTFEAIDTGTRIVDNWELETGHNGRVEALGTGKIKAAVAENLDKLKQLLERGETRLQDGRIITHQPQTS